MLFMGVWVVCVVVVEYMVYVYLCGLCWWCSGLNDFIGMVVVEFVLCLLVYLFYLLDVNC